MQLHPKAEQVEVKWLNNPKDAILDLVTTYTVDLSQEETVDYYKHTLVQQGWCLDFNTDSVLVYSFDHAAPQIGGSAVRIEILPGEGATTKVRIEARGTEVSMSKQKKRN